MPDDASFIHGFGSVESIKRFIVYIKLVSALNLFCRKLYVVSAGYVCKIARRLIRRENTRAFAVRFFPHLYARLFVTVNFRRLIVVFVFSVRIVAVVKIVNDVFITHNRVGKSSSVVGFRAVLPVARIAEKVGRGDIFGSRHRTEHRMTVTPQNYGRIGRNVIFIVFISVIIFAVSVVNSFHKLFVNVVIFLGAALTVAFNEGEIEENRLRKRENTHHAGDIFKFYV